MTFNAKQGRTALWVLALAATAAGMYYWGRHTGTETPVATNPGTGASETVSPARPGNSSGTNAATIPRYTVGSARPLPSPETPLRLVLAELQRRAASEPAAACRLAAEMEYCDGLRQRLANAENGLDNFERQLETMPQDTAQQREQRQRMADSYQSMTEKLLGQSEHCADVAPISAEQRGAYWRRAALAGLPAAMRHYASGNAFRPQELLDNLAGLATYRSEAESIARTGAQRGDVRMLASLAYAYSPRRDGMRRNLLSQAVKPDPVESLSLFMQLRDALPQSDNAANANAGPQRGFPRAPQAQRDMVEAQIRTLSRELSSEQASQARERAAERAQSWTRPNTTPPAPVTGPDGTATTMPPFFMQGFVPDTQRQECDSP
ncbi:MAG: hypothetical protein ACREP7_04100 [Lysobacter sp.]